MANNTNNTTTNSQYKKPGTVTTPTTKPSTAVGVATAGSPLPNFFGEGGILSAIPGITKTTGRTSTIAAAVTSPATTTTDEMEVETAKKPERESMDDIVDNIKVMNAPQKTQPTVSRTGTTHQKQAVESVRRKLDMESSAALDTAIFPQIEATIRAATSKSSSTSDDDDDDEDDDSDRDSDDNKEEEKKEPSSEKKKKTTTKTTTKVSEPKKNQSPVPKVVTPKAAASTAVVNNKRPRTATVNPIEAGVNTKQQQQQKVTKPQQQQSTEEGETAKSFTSEIAQLREKKQKLDETVQAAQKQLAEYTEINKTNVHAMEEIQRIEDSLVARKKELDAREEDIKRKEAGLEEMRALAMKLFPKVTAAQKK